MPFQESTRGDARVCVVLSGKSTSLGGSAQPPSPPPTSLLPPHARLHRRRPPDHSLASPAAAAALESPTAVNAPTEAAAAR